MSKVRIIGADGVGRMAEPGWWAPPSLSLARASCPWRMLQRPAHSLQEPSVVLSWTASYTNSTLPGSWQGAAGPDRSTGALIAP